MTSRARLPSVNYGLISGLMKGKGSSWIQGAPEKAEPAANHTARKRELVGRNAQPRIWPGKAKLAMKLRKLDLDRHSSPLLPLLMAKFGWRN